MKGAGNRQVDEKRVPLPGALSIIRPAAQQPGTLANTLQSKTILCNAAGSNPTPQSRISRLNPVARLGQPYLDPVRLAVPVGIGRSPPARCDRSSSPKAAPGGRTARRRRTRRRVALRLFPRSGTSMAATTPSSSRSGGRSPLINCRASCTDLRIRSVANRTRSRASARQLPV